MKWSKTWSTPVCLICLNGFIHLRKCWKSLEKYMVLFLKSNCSTMSLIIMTYIQIVALRCSQNVIEQILILICASRLLDSLNILLSHKRHDWNITCTVKSWMFAELPPPRRRQNTHDALTEPQIVFHSVITSFKNSLVPRARRNFNTQHSAFRAFYWLPSPTQPCRPAPA